ncbi:MAG: hypothetical protein IPL59_08545 [Candidatus Competibacteraceae bacterium]|uniref:Uncharacterized protein n=1 Tax=Candidatus Contendobacter odensis Run_B_J11 TaxID=1400861 RepID=A0A7U7G7F9_9GAMM|nr:hypothetical protein [Candidatus Contendobacter odensis]MBK8535170.1 hypothetical protein [Candidatus Competibacteraceae bacterium]CDH43107.1 exported hypothetical protein [Candidatus Contendobacter odensis Run_B_J11]
MAIVNFHQHVVHSGYSRRARFASLGSLLALTGVLLTSPTWATESTSSLKDPHVQTIAALQGADSAPITTSESAVAVNATWQVEIAYVVSEASSGVSQE